MQLANQGLGQLKSVTPVHRPEPAQLIGQRQKIARSLLLILAATAACTFFAACVGHQARVENRQERRADRQERREDRRANNE